MAKTFFHHVRLIKSEAWRKQRQLNYLAKCKVMARDHLSVRYTLQYGWKPVDPIYHIDRVLLHQMYHQGFTNGWLTIDLQHFEKIVKGEFSVDSAYPRDTSKWERKQERWRRKWRNRYPRRTAYRRKPEHKKKILTDEQIQKREWKAKKEKNHRLYSWRRGVPKVYKKMRAKLHRGWVKQNIYHERWDAFHIKEYTEHVNPWIWD